MKYSFMSFSTPELSLADMLDVAGRYGYDGIEPRLDSKHAHGIEVAATAQQRQAARKQAADAGIDLACLATSLKYSDPSAAEKMVQDTHARIDLAGDVGAPVMRVFGGLLPQGVTRERARARIIRSLSSVADHAGERGVTLCVETHDDWCNPTDVAGIIKAVNHPAVAVNWDIMHPVRTKNATIDESFDILRPFIRHLHVHDGTGEGGTLAPIGQGIIDHRRAIELLLGMGYDGYISGEWIKWEPWETHLPRELATMKAYEEELA